MAATGIKKITLSIALSCAWLLVGTAVADAQSSAAPNAAQQQQQQRDQQIAGLSVAERLVAIAQSNLLGPITDDALQQSEALIDAASRLAPMEPRYFRLLADTRMQLHDAPGAIAAWSAYRQLVPADRVAQVRLIDLYAMQMQTADGREKYLASLLNREGIDSAVKSHVATEAARLLLNRSKAEASAMADRAVKFYPLPEAVTLQYQLLDKNATPADRFEALLAIVRADPLQAEALSAAGELLSAQRLSAEATGFYSAAVDCLQREGVAPPHSLLVDFVASLYMSGADAPAKDWASGVLGKQPNDVDFQFLNLTILKKGDDPSPDDAVSAARDALSARWNELNNVIMGLPEPSADSGEPVVPPDPMPAANKLARAKPSPQTQRMKDAFISAMVDQAWLELYYAHKPQDAGRWTDALKVVAAGSPQLERLEGWYDLQTQKFEEAAQHFNAIKGTDVLAELGLIAVARSEATPKTLERARELKEKLLATHFDGLLDSIVHQALVPAAAAALPANLPGPPGPANAAAPTTGPFAQPAASADAQAMTAALKQFPMEVLSFSRQPEKFYGLHFTPLSTSCRYGQPIMATVSIVNTGDIDLPIDALGPLVPMFMYDGDAMGANSPPSRAIDELMGRLVLRPNEEVDQIVRLDQGALLYYLQQSISPGLTLISGDVYSNAVMGSTKVAAGPGGLRAGTSQLIGRQVPDLLNSGGRTQFYQDLQAGAADVRIDSLDLLWANGRWLHKRTQNEGDVQLAKEFLTVIDHYQTDPVSVVADWAKYRAATLPRPDGEKLIHALMTDKHWLARLLSLMAMQNEPYVIRRNMTAAMTKDSDATVKALADSTLNRLTVAATQPATQPDDLTGAATQPTLLPERP